MLSIRGIYAEVYSSTVNNSDFQELMMNGLDTDLVHDRLEEMKLLVGGIASYKFHLWINEECIAESISQLNLWFKIRSREDIDLRQGSHGKNNFFAIIEHSKFGIEDYLIADLQIEDISFETQRVIFDDNCELTLIFPYYGDSFFDIKYEFDSMIYTGVLMSTEYGFKQFHIE